MTVDRSILSPGDAPSPAPDRTAPAAPREGWEQPFPGYTVIEKIAQGGQGAVYRARDERLQREVAIKVLIPDLASRPDAVERFFAEARTTARLRHPNLVRGLDVGRAGKYFYYVMEFVRGESLAARLERLDRHRLPERETLGIVAGVAEALQYAFENGLVHRDVKPGNILLGEDGVVKLCDLGIAREVAFPDDASAVRGSPSYAAPEQIEGACDIDIRADLYGLGCTWFHLLLGHPPFTGVTPEAIARAHLETPPPNPRALNIRLSAATSQLVLGLLEKDRDNRPRTPEKFLAKLRTHPLLGPAAKNVPDPARESVPDSSSDASLDSATPDSAQGSRNHLAKA